MLCIWKEMGRAYFPGQKKYFLSLITSNGGCKQPSQQCTEVVPEIWWPRILKEVSEELPETLTVFVEHIERKGKLQRAREQHDPGLSPEMGALCTGHCSPACAEDLVTGLSGPPPQADWAPVQLVLHAWCHAGHVPASSMPAPSNCESIPGFPKCSLSLVPGKIIVSTYGRWIKH